MTHHHPRPRRSDPPSFLPSLPPSLGLGRGRTSDLIESEAEEEARLSGAARRLPGAPRCCGLARGAWRKSVPWRARGFLHAAEGEVIWARVRNRGGEDSEERMKGWIRVADISLTNIIPSSTEW